MPTYPDHILEYEGKLLRQLRDKRLAETDHWAYQDTPEMTAEQIAYRQALRDLPETYQTTMDVVWPTKPE